MFKKSNPIKKHYTPQPIRLFFERVDTYNPIQGGFLLWISALGKILTVIDWCCICKLAGETTDHLLFHCLIAGELWSMVYSFFLWSSLGYVEGGCAEFSKLARQAWNIDLGHNPALSNVLNLQRVQCQKFQRMWKIILNLKLLFLNSLFKWMNASGLFSFANMPKMLDSCTSSA